MSGRSQHHERGSQPGRGHQRPMTANAPPALNHGSGRDQPIEFLRIIGEYCAVKYHHVITNVLYPSIRVSGS
jgi:hypothetical protein